MSYQWNPTLRRYVDERGRVIPPEQIRQYIEEFITAHKHKFDLEGGKMVAGSVTIPSFFSWMKGRIKAMHGAAGVVAYGGEPEMNSERWERIENIIVREYDYLQGFRTDVENETDLETRLWPQDRATKYADSVYGTYENSVKAREGDNGLLRARRVTEEDRDVCDGCQAAATEEYLPLDEILDIGDADCQSRCRCRLEYDYAGIEPIETDREVYV